MPLLQYYCQTNRLIPLPEKLTLGHWTLSHDWQIDWLLKHQTLEELNFVDCVINRVVLHDHILDSEKYPVWWEDYSDWYWGWKNIWLYDKQWADVYAAIERGLPSLRSFSSRLPAQSNEGDLGPVVGYSAFADHGVGQLRLVLLPNMSHYEPFPPPDGPVSPQVAEAASVHIAQNLLSTIETKEDFDALRRQYGVDNWDTQTPEFGSVDWKAFAAEVVEKARAVDGPALEQLQQTIARRGGKTEREDGRA